MFLIGHIVLTLQLMALAPAQTKSSEFVFANENEPETIDPHVASGVPDNNIVTQLFEGLMKHGPDWVSLLPAMAESIPTPRENGKLYVFTLRSNLKWSDGSPLTAKDFEYSWLRAMRPETLGPYSYWLTDNIEGAKAYAKNPNPETAKGVGVKALDDRRFEVRLTKPVPYFLHLTAESIMFPVKKEVVETHGDRWTRAENIVSNGPFRMKNWLLNQKITMEKNPHYWDAQNVKLETVVALPLTDKQTAVNMFKQGRIDWSGNQGAPNALVPAFRKDQNFRTQPAFITYFYRFNTKRPPLDDKRVRQALALAIDRQAIVEKVTRSGETPALALVPPKTGSYKSPVGVVTGDHEANVAKAKALIADYLKETRQDQIRKLTLQYDTKELHKRIAQAIQQMWKENLGIEVQPFNQEWKVYLKSQRNMDFDISRSGWMGDYPDAATFLELFTSTSGNNHTGFSNFEYDEAFQGSNKVSDSTRRLALLQKAEAILLEELPIAPIYYYTNFSFIRPEVRGFEANLIDRPFVKYFSKAE